MSKGTRDKRELFKTESAQMFQNGTPFYNRPGTSRFPMRNFSSERIYQGINALYLQREMHEKGFYCPEWVTYSDADKMGLSVRKGEKGVLLEHWSLKQEKAQDEKHVHCEGYNVFNIQQLVGDNPILAERIEQYKKTPSLLEQFGRANAFLGTNSLSTSGNTLDDKRIAEYRKGIASAVDKKTNEMFPDTPSVSLRSAIATAFVIQYVGLPQAQPWETDKPLMQQWGELISKDDKELFRAIRDTNKIVQSIVQEIDLQLNNEDIQGVKEKDKPELLGVDINVENKFYVIDQENEFILGSSGWNDPALCFTDAHWQSMTKEEANILVYSWEQYEYAWRREARVISGKELLDLRPDLQEISNNLKAEAQRDMAVAQDAERVNNVARQLPKENLSGGVDISGADQAVLNASAKAADEIAALRSGASEKTGQSNAFQKAIESATAIFAVLGVDDPKIRGPIDGTAYRGVVYETVGEVPDMYAIQQISDGEAIIHRLDDINTEAKLLPATELEIVSDGGLITSVSTMQEILARQEQRQEQQEQMQEQDRGI